MHPRERLQRSAFDHGREREQLGGEPHRGLHGRVGRAGPYVLELDLDTFERRARPRTTQHRLGGEVGPERPQAAIAKHGVDGVASGGSRSGYALQPGNRGERIGCGHEPPLYGVPHTRHAPRRR
jgi:hypothetical protein